MDDVTSRSYIASQSPRIESTVASAPRLPPSAATHPATLRSSTNKRHIRSSLRNGEASYTGERPPPHHVSGGNATTQCSFLTVVHSVQASVWCSVVQVPLP